MANPNHNNEEERRRQIYAAQFREWSNHPITIALINSINEKRNEYHRLGEEAAYSGDEKKASINLLVARSLKTELEMVKTDQRK
jgi:hypothetical protein